MNLNEHNKQLVEAAAMTYFYVDMGAKALAKEHGDENGAAHTRAMAMFAMLVEGAMLDHEAVGAEIERVIGLAKILGEAYADAQVSTKQ